MNTRWNSVIAIFHLLTLEMWPEAHVVATKKTHRVERYTNYTDGSRKHCGYVIEDVEIDQ